MMRFNYYRPVPHGGEEYYPVTDNENPSYDIHVHKEDEAIQLVTQLNNYEKRVNDLTDELNALKKVKYIVSHKCIPFEIVNLIIERHMEEIRRRINEIGCNRYDDIETYHDYMSDIHLLDVIRQEILCYQEEPK